MEDFWKVIEELKWDGDYKRCEKELKSKYSQVQLLQLDGFIDGKAGALDHKFHNDWLEKIPASDDGWSDLRYEVVGRGKKFYEAITVEKLIKMAEDYDYHESFAYVIPYDTVSGAESNKNRALEIQKNDLEQWKTKLNAIAYEKLKEYCEQSNLGAETMDDVVRGDNLTIFILNLKI